MAFSTGVFPAGFSISDLPILAPLHVFHTPLLVKLSPDYSTVVQRGNNTFIEEFGKGGLLDRLLSCRREHKANPPILAPPHVLYTSRLVQTLPG